LAESSDPAAVAAVVEGQARPSSHILYLATVEGQLLEQHRMAEELASTVVTLEEVALTVVPSKEEGLAVAPVASLPASLASVVDSRVCTRVCHHHMNASALENVSSDCVIHVRVHGAGDACDIPLPQDTPLLLLPEPCLSCVAGVCG